MSYHNLLQVVIVVQIAGIITIFILLCKDTPGCSSETTNTTDLVPNGYGVVPFAQHVELPVVHVGAKNMKLIDYGNFERIRGIFNRAGFKEKTFIGDAKEWDVGWLYDLPDFDRFDTNPDEKMYEYQKLNHIPGISHVLSKVNLVSKGGKFIPPAFGMPKQKDEFIKMAEMNPNKTWVQKNINHRGVEVKKLSDLDLDSNIIVQEFIENPFLLDGYKFNMGVYVTVTSINPLRAYVYDSNIVIRPCKDKYQKGNYSDTISYDDNAPGPRHRDYHLNSVERLKQLGYCANKAIALHLPNEAKDYDIVRQQVFDAVRDVLISRQEHIKADFPATLFGSQNHFFEMARWDFLLDDQMKLHLMEANLSPNMQTADGGVGPMSGRKVRVENSLYNTFHTALVLDVRQHGAGSSTLKSIRHSDLNLMTSVCYDDLCTSCSKKECYTCTHCLSERGKLVLKLAYAEHINRYNLRRAYPEEMTQSEAANYDETRDNEVPNFDILLRAWLRAKCIDDIFWCR